MRKQAIIKAVGTMSVNPSGAVEFHGWKFDFPPGVKGRELLDTGEVLYAGYNLKELQEIMSRPSEFVVN